MQEDATRNSRDDAKREWLYELISANYSNYVRTAYSILRCSASSEDAVQEGAISAFKSTTNIDEIENPNAWLRRIVERCAIDIYRKEKRLPDLPGNDQLEGYDRHGMLKEPMWLEGRDPERILQDAQQTKIVQNVIEQLDDAYRIPLVLKEISGYSIKEVAGMLNLSQSNVKVRIHRARQKVKIQLDGYFYNQRGPKS